MKRIIISFLSLLIFLTSAAQNTHNKLYFIVDENGDTIFVDNLPPAYKFEKPPKGKKGKKWRNYYKLVHNFARAYPYALLAKEVLAGVDSHIDEYDLNKGKKTKYINSIQDSLFREFAEPLKNLTITQGGLLLRLIDRETGLPPYYILKKYKNTAAAGFWQGIARLFGSDMKRSYDPAGDDKAIEELVRIYQEGDFLHLYFSIFGKLPPEPVKRAECDFPQKYVF